MLFPATECEKEELSVDSDAGTKSGGGTDLCDARRDETTPGESAPSRTRT